MLFTAMKTCKYVALQSMLELRVVKVGVEAVLLKQLLVRAFFDYVALVHNENKVGVFFFR